MTHKDRSHTAAEAKLAEGLEQVRNRPGLRTALTFVAALCGGLAAIIIFFALIGQIDPTEATGMTVAVIVFVLIWLVAFWSRHARPDEKRVDWRNRERRGF